MNNQEINTDSLFAAIGPSRPGALTRHLIYYLLFIIYYFTVSQAQAQPLGTWQIYPAYTTCTQNIPVGKRIYALMETKLMVYDTEDESIQTFDWMRQLNDVSIQYMDYSPDARRIILVYDNGNIDLLNTEDDSDVINLSQLKNSTLQGKEIYSVFIYGENAYLATGFGVVVVDMAEGVIRKSYHIGRVVRSCTVLGEYLYVGTTSGIWRGSMNDNLQDPSTWTQVMVGVNPTRMLTFDGRVWAMSGKAIFQSNAAGTKINILDRDFVTNYTCLSNDAMIIGNDTQIRIIKSVQEQQILEGTYSWNSLMLQGNTFWASDGEYGLQSYTLSEDSTFQLQVKSIHPNSPLHDFTYHLHSEGDRLLIAGGNRHYTSTWREGTAMILEPDGTWRNFSPRAIYEMFPEERYRDVTNIAQDPLDPEHHYVGTTRNGIYEFRNGQPVAHIGIENAPFHSILPNNKKPQNYVDADGLRYDPEGNLWVFNCTEGRVDTTLRILTKSGQWTYIPIPEVNEAHTLDNIFFDSRGWAWLNSRRMSQRGIYLLDYNKTINNYSDDRYKLRTSITNQDGTTYEPDEFYCVTEDSQGYIWVGTNIGPFVITDPTKFYDNDFTFEQVKVARKDGSGLADYLLSDVPILKICEDGAGRKWFGTQGNGVYLMSADCQDQLQHFTTENSPLPSDVISDIYIAPKSGLVYFATAGGLCTYVADAIEPVEELKQDDVVAYPNPVRPDYTGPIAIRGLSRDCEVKILSATGQLVWSGLSNGGLAVWDGCNQRGRRVSSGVYHIVASTADGKEAVVSRITVIR